MREGPGSGWDVGMSIWRVLWAPMWGQRVGGNVGLPLLLTTTYEEVIISVDYRLYTKMYAHGVG